MGRYSAAAVAVLFATAGALVSQSLASKKSEMAQRLLATSSGIHKWLYRTLVPAVIKNHKRVMI